MTGKIPQGIESAPKHAMAVIGRHEIPVALPRSVDRFGADVEQDGFARTRAATGGDVESATGQIGGMQGKIAEVVSLDDVHFAVAPIVVQPDAQGWGMAEMKDMPALKVEIEHEFSGRTVGAGGQADSFQIFQFVFEGYP